jgi:hypothetical protein
MVEGKREVAGYDARVFVSWNEVLGGDLRLWVAQATVRIPPMVLEVSRLTGSTSSVRAYRLTTVLT